MIKISQSLLKDMIQDVCPEFIRLKYFEKIETPATPAMQKGLLFETLLLGASRGGAYEMPQLKSGKPSAAELSVQKTVGFAKSVLENADIKFDPETTQTEWEDKDCIAHIDCLGTFKNKGIIGDVKFTGFTAAQYTKELRWSPLSDNFLTQARHYQMMDTKRRNFLFTVFSEKGWVRFFGVIYDEERVNVHRERVMAVKSRVKEMEKNKFKSTPKALQCNVCPLNEICKKRNYVPEIENLIEL